MKIKSNLFRIIIQWGLFLFLTALWTKVLFNDSKFVNFEACCPMGGLQSLITFVTNGSLACTMEGMQVVMGALLAIATILFSKLFCGYVCPIGTITDGLDKLGKKLHLPKFEITGTLDIILRACKYALLFITIHYTALSNDLFCKLFDPYYAVASRYGEDTNFWYATIALVMVIGGAIFLRQFWCRYMCPLGAISNLFKYTYIFIAVAILGVILHQAKVTRALDITLAVACVLGFIFEIIGLKRKAGIQLVKVIRHPHTCIDCGLCSKNCPQGIQVDQMTSVNHPDCNLCAECITSCPKDGAIGLNGTTRFTWLPALITVIIVMIGLIVGAKMEIPTVDKNWGSEEQVAQSATFEMKGLKHIKCYGSSASFVNRMKQNKGIIGVKTFVGEHHVIINYDTTLISAEQVRRKIFIPSDIDIATPSNDASIHLYDLKVENYFDELDRVFVANTLKDIKGIYGFKTQYGYPIKLRIFGDSTLNIDSLKLAIENMDLVYKTPEKSFSSKGLFKVSEAIHNDTTYSAIYYKSLKFKNYQAFFNGIRDYQKSEIASIKIPIVRYPKNVQKMNFVGNYLKHENENILGIRSLYTENGPVVYAFYAKEKISQSEVIQLFQSDSITIHYNDGTVGRMKMPYKFETKQ